MIGQVTALLAGNLAAGGLLLTALLYVPNKLPPSFVRFCTAAAAALALAAAILGTSQSRFAYGAIALAGGIWYARARSKSKSPSVTIAVVSALIAVGAIAAVALVSAGAASSRGMAVAGQLSSALLLGAVTVTMILGHWYLVDTSLSIAPLKDGARYLWLAVAARWGVVLLVLAYGGFEMLRIGRAADLIFSTNGLFFLFRSLMGLAAPLLLAGLIWQTVKMRSTQSATGLLYVALILVLFGELVSQFLLVTTGYPL